MKFGDYLELLLMFFSSIGKNLALLQAEASACGFELANVPNVRWVIALLA